MNALRVYAVHEFQSLKENNNLANETTQSIIGLLAIG